MVRPGPLALLIILAVATPSAGFELEGFGDITLVEGPTSTDGGARDPNYLEPGSTWSGSGLGGYEGLVTGFLHAAFDDDVALRALVYPSFQPEYVVGIRNAPAGPVVFRMAPERSLWGYPSMQMIDSGAVVQLTPEGGERKPDDLLEDMKRAYPADAMDLPMSRCERPIDDALAGRIRAVWEAMIVGARPNPRGDFGLDGTTYSFSMPLAGGAQAEAHTWSPPGGTRSGAMVGISVWMGRYCQADAPEKIRSELKTAVDALAADLERAGEMAP